MILNETIVENQEQKTYYKINNEVFSFSDYTMVNIDINLYLNDGYKLLNLDYKQIGFDCGIASIMNILRLAGMSNQDIFNRLKNLDNTLDNVNYDESNDKEGKIIEEYFLSYLVKQNLCTDYLQNAQLDKNYNGMYLDGETNVYERTAILTLFGVTSSL